MTDQTKRLTIGDFSAVIADLPREPVKCAECPSMEVYGYAHEHGDPDVGIPEGEIPLCRECGARFWGPLRCYNGTAIALLQFLQDPLHPPTPNSRPE